MFMIRSSRYFMFIQGLSNMDYIATMGMVSDSAGPQYSLYLFKLVPGNSQNLINFHINVKEHLGKSMQVDNHKNYIPFSYTSNTTPDDLPVKPGAKASFGMLLTLLATAVWSDALQKELILISFAIQ